MLAREIIKHLRVSPGKKVDLDDYATGWAQTKDLRKLGETEAKHQAKEMLRKSLNKLTKSQELLYADSRHSVLVIFQALDAAGKDGTIKHVMSGVNPQGCRVHSFKRPSEEELAHTFLWRCMTRLPERGCIGIFNRSYYEDVLVVRVHPDLLHGSEGDKKKIGKSFWQSRFDDINAFERHLTRNGTLVVKFFLHISKDVQKKRFLERLERPKKHWKFSDSDIKERVHWDEYRSAYEEALSATSTKYAPWYVIPADDKWATRAVVADILATSIRDLDLKYPETTPERRVALAEARERLALE